MHASGTDSLKGSSGEDDKLGGTRVEGQESTLGRIIRPRTRTDPLPNPRTSSHGVDPTRSRGLSLLADVLQRQQQPQQQQHQPPPSSTGAQHPAPIAANDETAPKAPAGALGSGAQGTPPPPLPTHAHRGPACTSLSGGADSVLQHHGRRANAAAAAKAVLAVGGSGDRLGAVSTVTALAHAEISSPPLKAFSPSRADLTSPPGPSGSRRQYQTPAPSASDSVWDLSSENNAQATNSAHEQRSLGSYKHSLHLPEPAIAPGASVPRNRPSTPRTPVPISTQPIPIPARHRSSPTTPLTGRYHSYLQLESHFPSEDACSRALGSTTHSQDYQHTTFRRAPTPISPVSTTSETSSDALIFESSSLVDLTAQQILQGSPVKRNVSALRQLSVNSDIKQRRAVTASHARAFQVMNRQERSSHHSTHSQLSPHRKTSQPTYNMTAQRKAASNLQLPALPRFHPAVYQSPNASANTSPVVHRGLHVRSTSGSQSSHPQRSPQQQIYQYQRELIANVTRTVAGSSQAGSPRDTPKAPSLHPCGSPGPATPLALEDDSDYLTAGIVRQGGSRDLVDKLIREEHERRGGIGANRSSPAISPAGGRG